MYGRWRKHNSEVVVYYQDHMGAGGWLFMAFIGVVLLGLLVAFIVWLMQDQRRRPRGDHHLHAGTASEILDRRLALGEIGIPEYERLKASLAAATSGPAPSTEPPGAPQT
jgi:uncharacterized membrane protein